MLIEQHLTNSEKPDSEEEYVAIIALELKQRGYAKRYAMSSECDAYGAPVLCFKTTTLTSPQCWRLSWNRKEKAWRVEVTIPPTPPIAHLSSFSVWFLSEEEALAFVLTQLAFLDGPIALAAQALIAAVWAIAGGVDVRCGRQGRHKKLTVTFLFLGLAYLRRAPAFLGFLCLLPTLQAVVVQRLAKRVRSPGQKLKISVRAESLFMERRKTMACDRGFSAGFWADLRQPVGGSLE